MKLRPSDVNARWSEFFYWKQERTVSTYGNPDTIRYNHERAHNRGHEHVLLVTKGARIEYNYPYCVVLAVIMSAVPGTGTVKNRDKNKKTVGK